MAVAESMYTVALAASNPGRTFAFVGSDSLVAAARRDLRPASGSEIDRLLAALETTRAINAEWLAGRGYESNLRRAEHLRRSFLDHYDDARTRGSPPRLLVKLGANHAYRGRNLVNTYDVGALLPELAVSAGGTSVGILLVGGPGAEQASFDPRTFSYSPRPNVFASTAWVRPFFAVAHSAAWTVFDLRRLRAPGGA